MDTYEIPILNYGVEIYIFIHNSLHEGVFIIGRYSGGYMSQYPPGCAKLQFNWVEVDKLEFVGIFSRHHVAISEQEICNTKVG